MKICLINNLYKPLNRGGAEKITETIANGLVKAGHEVFIITTKPHFKKISNSESEIPIFYLNSFYYNLHKLPKFLRLFWHLWDMFDFIGCFKIKKILKKIKPDAVITGNLKGAGFLTVAAVKSLKIKELHLVHDIQLIHPSGLLYFGQEKVIESIFARNYAGLASRLIDSPDIVIFPSRWLLEMHLEKIFFVKSKRLVMPNPVENFSIKEANLNNGIFQFLFIGQIENHKGLFLLIEAFKKAEAKNKAISLIIAGSGTQVERLKLMIQDCPNIKFLGRVSEDKIDELLLRSDCLVYPSLVYENCPNAIQRAMALGLPVIGSDFGGIKELLNENAGLLFKPADKNDLAAKLELTASGRKDFTETIKAAKAKAESFRTENYLKKLISLLK